MTAECGRLRSVQDMNLMNFPLLVLAFTFVLLFFAAHVGDFLRNKVLPLKEDGREDFSVVLGATLTLLALLIGFSFSMAVSRYDQRKNYEEAEANAIGTQYLRGHRERSSGRDALLVLPVIASIAFFLIANIDSPYVGVISVVPHNLIATSKAM